MSESDMLKSNLTKSILQLDKLFKDRLKIEPDINKVIDQLVEETGRERAFIEESAISCGHLREKALEGYEFVRLRDLDASMIGKKVEIEVDVLSHQLQRAFPLKFKSQCIRCETLAEFTLEDMANDPKLPDLEELVLGKWEKASEMAGDLLLLNHGCEHKGVNKASVCRVIKRGDFAILSVKDRIEDIDQWDRGSQTPKWVYVLDQAIGYDSRVSVTGTVAVQSDRKKIGEEIVIFANGVRPLPSEYSTFRITEEDRDSFPVYFNSEKDIKSQIAPDMVGRDLVREARLLTLHSLSEIPDISGNQIRGSIHELNIGDTRTYKSKGMKDIFQTFNLGEPFSAETGRRTGLTYNIDAENRVVNMGVMPRNDRGLVWLDGMQRWGEDEIGQLREVLTDERIRVRAVASDDAWARCRIVGAMNPPDQLNHYIYRCQAIPKSRVFRNAPDIPRWDFWLIYGDDDVPKGDIAERVPLERPIPIDVFRRHVFWAWSRRMGDVGYSENAKRRIREVSTEVMEDYGSQSLPIVSNEFRDTLTRVSVACACLRHSTDLTHQKVIVKEVHVEEAVDFLKRMYDEMQLLQYIAWEEGSTKLEDSEFAEIMADWERNHTRIIEVLMRGPMSSEGLAQELDVSSKTIKRHYGLLKTHDLIRTSSKGAELTTKGILLAKRLIQNSGDIGTDSVPAQSTFVDDPENIGTRNVPVSPHFSTKKKSQEEVIEAISNILKSSDFDSEDDQLNAMREEGIENPEKWLNHLAEHREICQSKKGEPWRLSNA